MKPLILTACAALAFAGAAHAQTVVKETEAGVHSAPVAGSTPQAREHPSDDTTMMEKKTTTTVQEPSEKVVIEKKMKEEVPAEPTQGSPY